MKRGPTLFMLIELCARLRLACEAIGADGVQVAPEDVRLEDLAPDERARLERLGQQDLWALINLLPGNGGVVPRKRHHVGAA